MSAAIGTIIVVALIAVVLLVFIKVFKNTDLTENTESESFNTDKDMVELLSKLILAADARVKADSVAGVGEQFTAIRIADTNIICISKEIHQRITNLH